MCTRDHPNLWTWASLWVLVSSYLYSLCLLGHPQFRSQHVLTPSSPSKLFPFPDGVWQWTRSPHWMYSGVLLTHPTVPAWMEPGGDHSPKSSFIHCFCRDLYQNHNYYAFTSGPRSLFWCSYRLRKPSLANTQRLLTIFIQIVWLLFNSLRAKRRHQWKQKDSANHKELCIRTFKFLWKDCRTFYSEGMCLPHTCTSAISLDQTLY